MFVDGFEWKNIKTKIQHEFYLVRNLKPESAYIFRLSAHNTIGSSEFGIPSEIITTLEEGKLLIIICIPLSLKLYQINKNQ